MNHNPSPRDERRMRSINRQVILMTVVHWLLWIAGIAVLSLIYKLTPFHQICVGVFLFAIGELNQAIGGARMLRRMHRDGVFSVLKD